MMKSRKRASLRRGFFIVSCASEAYGLQTPPDAVIFFVPPGAVIATGTSLPMRFRFLGINNRMDACNTTHTVCPIVNAAPPLVNTGLPELPVFH